jgi:hypothetical protein
MRFFLTLFLFFNILEVYGNKLDTPVNEFNELDIQVDTYFTQIDAVYLILKTGPSNQNCKALNGSRQCTEWLARELRGDKVFADLTSTIDSKREASSNEKEIKEFIKSFFKTEFATYNDNFNALLKIVSKWTTMIQYPDLYFLFVNRELIISRLKELTVTLESEAFLNTISDVYYIYYANKIKSVP